MKTSLGLSCAVLRNLAENEGGEDILLVCLQRWFWEMGEGKYGDQKVFYFQIHVGYTSFLVV